MAPCDTETTHASADGLKTGLQTDSSRTWRRRRTRNGIENGFQPEGGVGPSAHDIYLVQAETGMVLTPNERTLRARLAAHALHAGVDSKQHTDPARRAFMARFEDEVDPDRTLPPAERARRAEHAKKAYFTRLALKSAQARRKATKPVAAARVDVPGTPDQEG